MIMQLQSQPKLQLVPGACAASCGRQRRLSIRNVSTCLHSGTHPSGPFTNDDQRSTCGAAAHQGWSGRPVGPEVPEVDAPRVGRLAARKAFVGDTQVALGW
jgi:hypothetical protein